ncbi:MAG TPA: SDR family oxidoreductase [Candidatus Saccharimonadales bacterium]|jgi:hypothetical protein
MTDEQPTEPDQTAMQDPTSQYDQINVSKSTQPEPGLNSKMDEAADHGETSYIGRERLTGRKALITGGDSGIGRATAIAFAREGADVALNYLPSEQSDAEEVAALIQHAGQHAVLLPGDLSDETFARHLVNDAAEQLDGLDILVNNAGKQVAVENIADITTEQLTATFTVNIFAMFWTVQEAIKHLPKGGVIINTTSIQATQPSADLLDYAATKAAILNFTRGLSQQLIEKGIRVNAVAPGPIWTPLQPSGGQMPDALPEFGEQTPMGRAGQPAELASAYVFLASQESSYVTGEIIGVTGGMLR